MDKNFNPISIHILATLVTMILMVGVVHFWLPDKVDDKAKLVLSPVEETVKVAKVDDSSTLTGLLDYIKEKRGTDGTLTDSLNEGELIDTYEDLQQDFTGNAQDILAKRFKVSAYGGENLIGDGDFEIPDDLQEMVAFWTHIFGHYNRNHLVFYNMQQVGVVYSVLDFSELTGLDKKGVKEVKADIIAEERTRLRKMIRKLASYIKANKGQKNLNFKDFTEEERRIGKLLFERKDHLDLSEKGLKKSFAYRYGFSHRIKGAIKVSGLYMDEMRRIFRERGLPEELTIIPFIESAFNLKAYSRAGAAGIWQFIKATGQRYLRIDEFVDERYDPILGAYAAATHLRNEFKLLKSWPLTINAYNTGPGRMLQAKRKLQTTDISRIIKEFRGRGYGFDSRNYYPEFLAALTVFNNQEFYFGDIQKLSPQPFEYVAMPSSMSIPELSRLASIPIDVISDLNLPLKDEVLWGEYELPKGYLLKIPPTQKEDLLLAMQELYRDVRFASHHVVKRGDDLKKISKKYDVTLKELAQANNLLPHQKLKRGSVIQLPGRGDTELTILKNGSDERVLPDTVNTPVF